jgi:hypothetical protein
LNFDVTICFSSEVSEPPADAVSSGCCESPIGCLSERHRCRQQQKRAQGHANQTLNPHN